MDQPAPDGAELVQSETGHAAPEDDTIPAAARSDPPPSKKRPPLTEKGQILVAAAKTTAIRCALRDRRDHLYGDILAILVLALAGDNVSVRGDPASPYRLATFHDLAARLVQEDGTFTEMSLAETTQIAAEAAARMIVCDPTGGRGNTSGRAAEWIGLALEASRDMPRLDTGEILATVSGDALKAADIARGGTGKGTSKAIRERLTGNAEDLVPARQHLRRAWPEAPADAGRIHPLPGLRRARRLQGRAQVLGDRTGGWRMNDELTARYQRAMHAMQSGVAMDQSAGSPDGTPKHLRVGINAAMSDISAIATLLIAKGVITLEEYELAIVEGAEKEAARYEQSLSERFGRR